MMLLKQFKAFRITGKSCSHSTLACCFDLFRGLQSQVLSWETQELSHFF